MTALYKYLAGAALLVLLVGGVWLYWVSLQDTIEQLHADLETAQRETTEARAQRDSAQATTRVVTQTVEKVVEVKVKGDTIIQKVPVYVTEKADTGCTVTNGAVSVLNSAAANVLLPGNPGGVQDGPSGVALSTVTRTAAEWASLYWQLAERYKGLREWAETQGAICRGGGVQQQK
jgi:hypothetical protein